MKHWLYCVFFFFFLNEKLMKINHKAVRHIYIQSVRERVLSGGVFLSKPGGDNNRGNSSSNSVLIKEMY